MNYLHHIAEAKIRDAIDDGVFDDFEGKGKPLELSDVSGVSPELRAAYSLLKNAGVLPEEMELRKSLLTLRDLIDACTEDGERDRLIAQQRDMSLRYELMMEKRGRRSHLAGYRAAVMARLFR